MIIRKSAHEIELMAAAGAVVAGTLALLDERLEPGISMAELDRLADDYIAANGGVPTSKGYKGFPAATCISPNEHDRPRHPRRLPRPRGRHHLLRHRRDQGRDDRRLGRDLPGRRDLAPRRSACSTSAAPRSRPGSRRPSCTPRSATSPPRSRRSSRRRASRSCAASSATASASPTTRTRRCRTSSSPTAAPSSSRG